MLSINLIKIITKYVGFYKMKFNFSFLEKHWNKINWELIVKNKHIPSEFYEKYMNILEYHQDNGKFNIYTWDDISKNPNIPLLFFKKYYRHINWYYFSGNEGISVEYFKENIQWLHWDQISENENIPEIFIQQNLEKYDNMINWRKLCGNKNLSESFFKQNLEKYKDKINWEKLCANKNISELFFLPIGREDREQIIKNKKYEDKIYWKSLCGNENISESFFLSIDREDREKYENKLNWKSLCGNKNLTVKFWEKYKDKINWFYFSCNETIPIWFFEQNLDKLDWFGLCENRNIPDWFYEKYIDKIDWSTIDKIPFKIFLEYFEEEFVKLSNRNYNSYNLDEYFSILNNGNEKKIENMNTYTIELKLLIQKTILKKRQKLFLQENVDNAIDNIFHKLKQKLNWNKLSLNMSYHFLKKHINLCKQNGLIFNTNIPLSFIETLIEENKINWDELCESSPLLVYEDNINKLNNILLEII